MKASYKERKSGMMMAFYDVVMTVRRFFIRNLNNFANIMIGVAPFMFLAIGEWQYSVRGYFAIGGELLMLAPLWVLFIALFKMAAKRNNVMGNMPIPIERFTQVNGDEVNVNYDQVNDLLLYVADLEDWFEREGYTNGR